MLRYMHCLFYHPASGDNCRCQALMVQDRADPYSIRVISIVIRLEVASRMSINSIDLLPLFNGCLIQDCASNRLVARISALNSSQLVPT